MDKQREDIEIALFLEALFRFHGYDLREYSQPTINRRIRTAADNQNCRDIASLIPLIAHQPELIPVIINDLTIQYTYLFRDPEILNRLRLDVFPYLASFPRIHIWIAGCAGGEEAFSLAILLEEAGLLDRCQLYATDINRKTLNRAASGIVYSEVNCDAVQRYQQAGGCGSLSDYFICAYNKLKLNQATLSRIHFEHHNLAQQPPFITAQLILCRNVLIYFNKQLQGKVLQTLTESLDQQGILTLGNQESLNSHADQYQTLNQGYPIYRKTPHSLPPKESL